MDILFPKNTILHANHGKYNWFLIERQPRIINLVYDAFNDGGDTYELSIPYSVFSLVTHSPAPNKHSLIRHRLFFNKNRTTKITDYLHGCWLTNVKDYNICIGNVNTKLKSRNKTVAEYVDDWINTFWNSIFTDDYTNNVLINAPAGCKSYGGWQNKSKADRLFWIDCPFRQAHTVHIERQIFCDFIRDF